jgi:tetratricopeptide (TPR) repeat protein
MEMFEEEEEDLRNTPEYKRRQLITRIGTSILLFAFVGTSGITCFAGMANQPTAEEQAAEQAGNTTINPMKAEIARFREEIKKDPNDTNAMGLLGVYLLEQAGDGSDDPAKKDRAEARQLFEAVLQKEPDNFQMYQYLGAIALVDNDLAKARDAFNKAVELTQRPVDPQAPDKDSKQSQQDQGQVESRVGLALLHFKQKNYEGSLQELDAALKLNPGYAKGYLLRAKVQMDRKQPEQARRDLQLALDVAKTKPQGSREQMEIFAEYSAAMKILDPNPVSSATPSPAASATPAPAASSTPALFPSPVSQPLPLPGATNSTSANGTVVVNATTSSSPTPP